MRSDRNNNNNKNSSSSSSSSSSSNSSAKRGRSTSVIAKRASPFRLLCSSVLLGLSFWCVRDATCSEPRILLLAPVAAAAATATDGEGHAIRQAEISLMAQSPRHDINIDIDIDIDIDIETDNDVTGNGDSGGSCQRSGGGGGGSGRLRDTAVRVTDDADENEEPATAIGDRPDPPVHRNASPAAAAAAAGGVGGGKTATTATTATTRLDELDDDDDAVWRKFYMDEAIHSEKGILLEHFRCPMWSDLNGIDDRGAYDRIPDEEGTWSLFEDAYYSAYNMDHVKRPPPWEGRRKTGGEEEEEERDGFFDPHRGMLVPFEVRYMPKIGRGLYATEFIPAGTKIWEGTSTAVFSQDFDESAERFSSGDDNDNDGDIDGDDAKSYSVTYNRTDDKGVFEVTDTYYIPEFGSYRRFLEYLHDRRGGTAADDDDGRSSRASYDWACDAIMWTYESVDEHDNAVMCVSFDHGVLFNDARDNETAANVVGQDCEIRSGLTERYRRGVPDNFPLVRSPIEPYVSCTCFEVVAARDISAGEELRYDYEYFDDGNDEKNFGDDDVVYWDDSVGDDLVVDDFVAEESVDFTYEECDDHNDPDCFYLWIDAEECDDENDPDCVYVSTEETGYVDDDGERTGGFDDDDDHFDDDDGGDGSYYSF